MIDLLTTSEGEYIARRLRRDPIASAHAMLLTGYNDEYKMKYNTKGGLIV